MSDRILIIDFGSQYAQIIARRVRDMKVFCELLPWNASKERLLTDSTKGVILSGGPNSVYAPSAPVIPDFILESGLPILGICYGMQALTHALGGVVSPSDHHEYGQTQIEVLVENKLLAEPEMTVLMSHGDRITQPPPGWQVIARSNNSPVAAMADFANLSVCNSTPKFITRLMELPSSSILFSTFASVTLTGLPNRSSMML